MSSPSARIHDFVTYVRKHLSGDEKGEAQIFCDRLFQAFGHPGIKEAGGQPVTAPGLPPCVTDPAPFITEDCIRVGDTRGGSLGIQHSQ
jgi:hypothetical protein